MHLVSDCQEQFHFVLPSIQLARRAEKFMNKLHFKFISQVSFLCFLRVCYQFLVNKRFIY